MIVMIAWPFVTVFWLWHSFGGPTFQEWQCSLGWHSYGPWTHFDNGYVDGAERFCKRCNHRTSQTIWDNRGY